MIELTNAEKNNCVNNIITQLLNFYKGNSRNQWIFNEYLKMYVRKSQRYFNSQILPFIDIASIEIGESYQGQGLFPMILDKILQFFESENIFVESILNPKLEKILKDKGFVKQDEIDNNLYLVRYYNI